tara:strand:+ start:633 stop:2027 length:1395 start_codon:yes stop_codon:yes gene_type:complete
MKLFLTLLSLVLMTPFLSAQELNTLQEPPEELTRLISQLKQKQKTDTEEAFQSQRKFLKGAYLIDLEAAIKKTSATGNEETFAELNTEKTRIEADHPIKAEDYPIFTELIELRKSLRQVMESLQAEKDELNSNSKSKLDVPLNALQVSLVKQLRFDDAIAVRDFRKGDGMEELIRSGSAKEKLDAFSFIPANPPPGGRLRAYSNVTGENNLPMNIALAEPYSDFINAIVLSQGSWAAVRRDGSVVSNLPIYSALENVARFPRNNYVLYRDGTLESITLDPGVKIENVIQVAVGHVGGVALTDDRKVHTFAGLESPGKDLEGVTQIGATWGGSATAYQANEESFTWGTDPKRFAFPDNMKTPVEIDCGWNNFMARTESGKVFIWPADGDLPDLPPVIDIELHCRIYAAQKEDLSWIAWGDPAMGVLEKINQIGPARHLSYEANGYGWGYLLWIEPLPHGNSITEE